MGGQDMENIETEVAENKEIRFEEQGESNEAEKVENGVHNYSTEDQYVWPTEPQVLRQLEWFQDQKLGFMMHWGPYSQLGVVESWALSDMDAPWSRTEIDWEGDAKTFKEQYFGLNRTFNPIRFQPDVWAKAVSEAGFRYMLFTTKHHDGFCMWDTKYSDYKITALDCPFHTNRYADICAHLFEEMRKRGVGVIAYFSKADWHNEHYWNDGYERGTFTWRGPSYRPEEYPEEWEKFVQFTQNQVKELATEYGKLDGLWFDAGWVCKESGQDIRLGEMMDDIRRYQPWILSADRTIGGPYENYVTPEQCVPERPLSVPWESCITMGTSFSFKYEDIYKSAREIACLLMNIVAKGGNLALNVGPQPDGRLPQGALKTMKELGEWMKVYGEGIYATRVCAPYSQNGILFTAKEKEHLVYAFRMYASAEETQERELFIPLEREILSVKRLGSEEEVAFEKVTGGYRLSGLIPEESTPIAAAFRFKLR